MIFGFTYKGTKIRMKLGDRVIVSQRWANQNGYPNRLGAVVDLHGFITVLMDYDNQRVDFDARMIEQAP